VECHATCIRCGRSLDVNIDANNNLEQQTASATGFVITGHRLEFYGLCPSCAGK
jgi:Fur family peroxide stress response transcriptional regulator